MGASRVLRGRVTVVRRRAGAAGKDQYGEALPGTSEALELPPGMYAPAVSSEPVGVGSEPVVTPATVYWRGGDIPDIQAEDTLLLDGVLHSVVGRPLSWPLGLQVQVQVIESKVVG